MSSFQALWKRKNYRTATIIGALSLLWMASGMVVSSGGDSNPENAKAKEQKLTMVEVQRLQSSQFPLQVRVRARTEANRQVDLRAEVVGRVSRLPLEKGSLVKAGDVICEIAAEDRPLRLAETQAAVTQAQLEYDGSLRLKSGGYQSKTAIAGAKTRLQTAKANLQRRQLDVANLKIRAPFDGVVNTRPVELGDYLKSGDVCAHIIDLDPIVLRGEVSEANISSLKVGGLAQASLRTGEQVEGKIRYIGRESNTNTRTFPIEVEVANPDAKLLSGITSQMVLPVANVEAFHIPASLLSLDDEGKVGVRIVDEMKVVQFYTVDIIGDDGDGVWILGLPEASLLITVGQEYVSRGEKVTYRMKGNVEEGQAASL